MISINLWKILSRTRKILFDLAEREIFLSLLQSNQAIDQTISMAKSAIKSDQGIVGVPSGLTALDEKLGGLHKIRFSYYSW